MKLISIISNIILLNFGLEAATFSGSVENQFGDFLGFTSLTATNTNTGDVVTFSASRNGSFSVELSDGTWIMTADPEQIAGWGYSILSDYEITINGSDLSQDIILFASEPLEKPSFSFELDLEADRISYTVNGQGGTRVTIYTSFDLKSWSPVPLATNTISKTGGGFSLTTPNNFNPYKRFFRVVSTTE